MSDKPTEPATSVEHRILRAVKSVLTDVVKDTATAPGLRHPLSDKTIDNIRECLKLISARERIDMPIAEAVYRVLYEEIAPQRAVSELLSREPARE